jgi:glycosyltransferase involved in cell wall biosynthesis
MILPWSYILRNAQAVKIITSHEVIKPGRIDRYFMKEAIQSANVITSPSRWEGEYLRREYGREFLRIPNGVETETFKPLSNIKRRDDVVLYVGRFNRNKGALDLVEAARRLPEYQFWFRGSAQPANVGRQGVEIPRLSNIRIIEFIPDRRALAALYNESTICAFPSRYENFPLVGLEAMACGRTLVATKGPRNGYSEYVEDGVDGLLVEPSNIDALVKSIRYLMANKTARDEFEQNASKKAAQYDWKSVIEKYVELFQSLLRQ